MRKWIRAATAALAISSTTAPASAALVTIDMAPYVNGYWSQHGFGAMPTGDVTLGGTPFDIHGDSGGPRHWTAAYGGQSPVELTVNTNIANVTNVYTLISNFWGYNGSQTQQVTFNATGGVSQSFTLVGGTDIRDYVNNSFANEIGGDLTEQVFSLGVRRLDRQSFDLADGFMGQTLTSIVFRDTGGDGISRLTLTAITLETGDLAEVPEPAMLGLFGLGLIGLAMRRRGRA